MPRVEPYAEIRLDWVTDKIPARFRKTKTEKWAVMAPVADLEAALERGGVVDVQKKSGDWTTFTIGSLGNPFDVDGVQMCYGYAPDDSDGQPKAKKNAPIDLRDDGTSGDPDLTQAPAADSSEPLPDYQGGPEDEWEAPF